MARLEPSYCVQFSLFEVLLKLILGKPFLGINPHALQLVDNSFVYLAIISLLYDQGLKFLAEGLNASQILIFLLLERVTRCFKLCNHQ